MTASRKLTPADEGQWPLYNLLRQTGVKELPKVSRGAKISEIDFRDGVSIRMEFPDSEGLLDNAIADLKKFFKLTHVKIAKKDGVPLICRFGRTSAPESYRVAVTANECVLESLDIQGIRRGIYYLMNEMLIAEGPFLKLGELERGAIIGRRFARPWPIDFYNDELEDDSTVYPPEYLSTLARETVNSTIIKVDLKKFRRNFRNRIARLDEIVSLYRRYGIKVYLLCTEPVSFDENSSVYKDCPELFPDGAYSSQEVRDQLASNVGKIFKAIPELGGLIIRSVEDGCRLATCVKTGSNSWRTAAATLDQINKSIGTADLIFWPYQEIFWRGLENMIKGASQLPAGVIQLQMLEAFGVKQQMGTKRTVADNWLSYAGPSMFFKACTKKSRLHGAQTWAMLPSGISGEVPTVQSIPVPSSLYRKYRAMRSLDVSGTLQCWEYGSYPTQMTHAAGLLTFEPFPPTEDIFLTRLARIYWADEFADDVVKAWKHFSQAFNHFPLCHEFRDSGLMQDSVVWPLNLIPSSDNDLGERLESLLSDCEFDMEETIKLTTKLARRWHMGVKIMLRLKKNFRRSPTRTAEIARMEALGILFNAGNDLFKFYELRCRIFNSESPERLMMLKSLRKMARCQIEYSKRMIALIDKDPLLGFHFGEGVFKFDQASLQTRIESIKRMLAKEFPVIEKRLKAGLPAIEE